MTMFQEAVVETRYGVAKLVATDANHVHFDANHNSGMDGEFDPRSGPYFLTVNGVEMGVSAHVHRHADGVWRIGTEDRQTPFLRYQDLYATRRHWTRIGDRDVSRSARAKLEAEIERVVNDWANFGDGSAQRLLAQADLDQADRDVAAAEAAVEKAREAYAAAQSEAVQAGVRRQQAWDAAWDAGIRPEGVAS